MHNNVPYLVFVTVGGENFAMYRTWGTFFKENK